MRCFATYLAAGIAIIVQVTVQSFFEGLTWVVILQIAAFVAGLSFVIAASLLFFRQERARLLARLAVLLASTYYVPAIVVTSHNVLRRGSAYPFQLFVPPILLGAAALVTRTKTEHRPPTKWAILTAVLLIVAVPIVAVDWQTPSTFFLARKVVTLQTSWKRGDTVYGPNYVELHLRNGTHQCKISFFPHEDFAQYITSFGHQPVPVTYEVFYDTSGEAISANFVRVGSWPSKRFHENEGQIGPYGSARPGESLTLRTPQDCFVSVPPGAV